MPARFHWGIVFSAALCASAAHANSDDIELTLRLTREPPVFHAGESIPFEIAYTTRTAGKYRGRWENPNPGAAWFTLRLSPTRGLVDLISLRENPPIDLSAFSAGNLDPQNPITERADLAAWYRFEAGGHYELRVSSHAVARIQSAEEGGGTEPITLDSNTVEFDVLPPDEAWEAGELASAEQDLAAGPAARAQAILRLARMDTAASIRKLVSLFLAGDGASNEIYRALRDSSHPEWIVPLLDAALADPKTVPASALMDLLASLQVRQALGPPKPLPADPARRPEWKADWEKRDKRFQDYMAQDTARLLATLRRTSGQPRAAALDPVWWLMERHNGWKPEAPASLLELRREMLAAAALNPAQSKGFVTEAWRWRLLPREQLLPLVRELALYPLWCEEAPRDCSEAILAEAAKPDSAIAAGDILLMKEAEHPELDALCKRRLAALAAVKDAAEAHRTGALVLRAGSRNLRPAVQAALDRLAGARAACELQAYLVNYQIRLAPADAAAFLKTAFQDRESFCGWLGFLAHTRYSDDLIPFAMEALESPNPTTAASAALLLGGHGPPDTEDRLWRHLDALWAAWREHTAALPAADSRLEQALVNALLHGAHWTLSPPELERLRAGCLTDECREVAAGKIVLGF